ncbi:MAG: hypothetical protein ABR992_06670 [Solirubrobacteraceae bacterium]|jgi:hypothetical protein
MATVELTADQSACIESLSEDCVVVGVQEGCPLVRLAGGELALLESNGCLAPARGRIQAATSYMEVGGT